MHGTATAAALWATGAIGLATGIGAYDVAVAICGFTALTLYVLSRLKPKVRRAADSARADRR